MHPRKKLKYVEVCVAALLKEHGFKKDSLTWRRERNRLTDIVNLQLSQWNTQEEVTFFVNLGIFDGKMFKKKYGYKEKKPKEWQCQKWISLKNPKKRGFEIDKSTDEKKLAQKVVVDLETNGFPWFEQK